MKTRQAIIAINGIDTDLKEIDIDKYKLVAVEKSRTYRRYFYKPAADRADK